MNGRARSMSVSIALTCAMVFGVSGVAQAAELVGTEGPDTLQGTPSANVVIGLGSGDLLRGEDSVLGAGADDAVYGDAGDDAVFGGPGDDLVVGGDGADLVGGTNGADALYGSAGDDLLADGTLSDSSGDLLSGGLGNDELDAYNEPAYTDVVECGPGDDLVYADVSDVVAADCEEVVVGFSPNGWKRVPYNLFPN